jgi:hypothetical protein
VKYGSLLSTVPLDVTCRMVGQPAWADGLTHSNSHIIGLGVRGVNPHGCVQAAIRAPSGRCAIGLARVYLRKHGCVVVVVLACESG